MKQSRHMNLAAKLGIVISVILVIIFVAQISFTVVFTKNTISKTIGSELSSQAQSIGVQIQQVFDEVDSTIENIQDYLIDIYEESDEIREAGKNNQFTSSVYQVPLKQVPYEMERFLVATSHATTKNADAIYGMGAMFEPQRFAANIDSYSFYLTEEQDERNIKPYGDYDSYSQELFYSTAKEEKQKKIFQPTQQNGRILIPLSAPIVYNDQVMGIIKADIEADTFSDIQMDTSHYKSKYALVIDDYFTVVYDSRSTDTVGKSLEEITGADNFVRIQEAAQKANGAEFNLSIIKPDGSTVTGFFSPVTACGEQWWSLTALDTNEMTQAVRTASLWLVVIAVIALALLLSTVITILRRMLAPIRTVVDAAEQISSGNFDIELQSNSQDEIGVLVETFNNTAHTLKRIITDISSVLNSISGKNLDVDVSEGYVGDLKQIQDALTNIIANLNQVMGDIGRSADQVANGSSQVSDGAQALSQGATEQASAVQELAATINEISQQISKNAQNAREANQKAGVVGQEAQESNRRMRAMLDAMSDISNSSNEIGKIIKNIEDIAFQTNILALNAAVEAARAGAAGKGFAVVASEVRNLASKSAEASKNTSVLIENSLRAVENGTKIAGETAESLNTVVEGVKDVAVTIDRIAAASGEQASSVAQVTQGVDQISSVVQTNSATAEQSAAASEELSSQAQILRNLVSDFTLKTGSMPSMECRSQLSKSSALSLPNDISRY